LLQKIARLPKQAIELLAPYFPELDLENIIIIEGVPWYVPMKSGAYTDRNYLYFAPGTYDPCSLAGLTLIAHELAHTLQYKQYGKWNFRFLYLKSWLVELCRHLSFNEAYARNCFEVSAREVETQVYDDLCNRKPA